MLINFNELTNLPVQTESGDFLGHLINLDINTETHSIAKYHAQKKKILKTSELFLIAPEQIVKIDEDKIIVRDNVTKEAVADEKKQFISVNNPATINAERE